MNWIGCLTLVGDLRLGDSVEHSGYSYHFHDFHTPKTYGHSEGGLEVGYRQARTWK